MEDRAKDLKFAELADHYRPLLTDKQNEIFDMYYNLDYSLAEISEDLGIARQSVRDCLVRCRETVLKYEQQLRLSEKTGRIRELCALASNRCEQPEIQEILSQILKILEV